VSIVNSKFNQLIVKALPFNQKRQLLKNLKALTF
jgi:hypothetical protein